MITESDFIKTPIAELQKPKNGYFRVIVDNYWYVTEDNKLFFYKSYNAPQCNPNKATLEFFRSKDRIFPHVKIQKIDYVLLPIKFKDYI
jgi:hypothetical protein